MSNEYKDYMNEKHSDYIITLELINKLPALSLMENIHSTIVGEITETVSYEHVETLELNLRLLAESNNEDVRHYASTILSIYYDDEYPYNLSKVELLFRDHASIIK